MKEAQLTISTVLTLCGISRFVSDSQFTTFTEVKLLQPVIFKSYKNVWFSISSSVIAVLDKSYLLSIAEVGSLTLVIEELDIFNSCQYSHCDTSNV